VGGLQVIDQPRPLLAAQMAYRMQQSLIQLAIESASLSSLVIV
jgi:hypothetical protein